jgi:hypothetical protein
MKNPESPGGYPVKGEKDLEGEPSRGREGREARRVLKFRAWDPINKRMYKAPCIIFESNGTFEAYDDAREWEDGICRNSILMQFTGLQDKHGRDIYEGDILKIPSFVQTYPKQEQHYAYHAVTFSQGKFHALATDGWGFSGCEVVGNIYEVPSEGEALPERSSAEGPTSHPLPPNPNLETP